MFDHYEKFLDTLAIDTKVSRSSIKKCITYLSDGKTIHDTNDWNKLVSSIPRKERYNVTCICLILSTYVNIQEVHGLDAPMENFSSVTHNYLNKSNDFVSLSESSDNNIVRYVQCCYLVINMMHYHKLPISVALKFLKELQQAYGVTNEIQTDVLTTCFDISVTLINNTMSTGVVH